MDFKGIFRFGQLIVSLTILTGCPAPLLDPDMDCGALVDLEDGGTFSPHQNTFSVGDTISLSLNIPVVVNLENNEMINLFEKYGEASKSTFLFLNEFVNGNEITIAEGQLDNNFGVVIDYSETTQSYNFVCDIILEETGFYALVGASEINVMFGNDTNCAEAITVTTNIMDFQVDGLYPGQYVFTVE